MKIWWQQPMPEKIAAIPTMDKTWEGVLAQLRKVARPGTEITQHFLSRGTLALHTDYLRMYNNMSVVESVVQAEKQGYDAVVIGCWGDPGLREARAALNIPVVGLAEASYLFSMIVGRRAAAITVQSGLIHWMEATLKLYGFKERMIYDRPLRSFEMTDPETGELFIDPHKTIIPKFEAVARECIKDGADTILAACGWLGPALSKVGYKEIPDTKPPIPVIDGAAVGLKLAEAYVDLHKSLGILKSGSVYPKVGKTVKRILKQDFGVDLGAE